VSTIYGRAGGAVIEMAAQLIHENYPGLAKAAVRIDYLFARASLDDAGEPAGSAITHNGYPANGLCRILGLKDRVMGRGDCEIIIDGDQWPKWNEAVRRALIDHELYHIELCIDYRTGILKKDDIGRPKLRLRKHDFQVGWFHEIAERHGRASFEVRQALTLKCRANTYFQGELAFAPEVVREAVGA
jgi:hypothetical protein